MQNVHILKMENTFGWMYMYQIIVKKLEDFKLKFQKQNLLKWYQDYHYILKEKILKNLKNVLDNVKYINKELKVKCNL